MKKILHYKSTTTQYSGFLLIELLVAIALMAAFSLAIARYQGYCWNSYHDLGQRVVALHKASSFLDELIGSGVKVAPTGKKEDPDDDFVLTWHTFTLGSTGRLGNLFRFITVNVSWEGHRGNTSTLGLTTGLII